MFLDMLDDYTQGGRLEAQKEFRYNCPFCGDDRHKFYVQDSEPYLWHCKYCDRRGNPVKFVMLLNSVPFSEAKDMLATYDYYVGNQEQTNLQNEFGDQELTESEKLFLLMHKDSIDVEEKEVLQPNKLPYGFSYLWDDKEEKKSYPYFNYLLSRGITLEDIKNYNIGYVDNGGYNHPETGKYISLITSVVFITYNDDGNPIYWNTRSINPNSIQKSINAPAMDGMYSKRTSIFNLDKAKKTDKIVIYEGVFNALMSGDSGIATFGKQVTDEQIELIKEASAEKELPIYLFLDNDAKQETNILANKIYQFTHNVYIVINPYGDKDANDLGRNKVQELIDKAVKFDNSGRAQILFNLS